MRIAIDAVEMEGRPTGVGRYLGNLLNCWKEIAPDEEIYLIHKEEIAEEFLNHPGIRLVRMEDSFFASGLLRQQVALPGLLGKITPDVFFAPAYSMPLFWNGPTVLTVHDISFQSYPQWFSRIHGARMRFFTKSSVKKAAKIITDSHFIKDEIIATYGISEEKVEVIYLGFDDELKKLPFTKEADLRAKFWLEGPFALMVGTVFERRYPLEVIRAFLDQGLENEELVIAGADRRLDGGNLQDEIDKLELREKVIWLDYVSSEDLMGLYRSAKCLVYLSEYEGFGLPPLEGMAFGLPVLVSKKGTLEEVYGKSAMMVTNEEESEIAEALKKLMQDEELRTEYITRGDALSAKLNFRDCAEKTIRILRETGKV